MTKEMKQEILIPEKLSVAGLAGRRDGRVEIWHVTTTWESFR